MSETGRLLPITDEQARAVQEVAKATQEALKALEGIGGFLRDVLSDMIPIGPAPGTFDWLASVFKAHQAWADLDRKTRRLYDQGLALFSSHVLKDGTRVGSKRIADFTRGFVDAIYAKLLTVKETTADGTIVLRERRRYTNAAMTACRRAWFIGQRAEEKQVPALNPFAKMGLKKRRPGELARETPAATWDELVVFRKKAVELGYTSIATAALVAWEWLQREEHLLGAFLVSHYRPKERPHAVRIVHPKNGEEAYWPLFDEAQPNPEKHALFPELMAEMDAMKARAVVGIRRHERFANAAWALPEEQLAPLRSLAERYAPTDPISAIASLFNEWSLDDSSDLSSGAQRRSAALRQLYAVGGADAVLQLAAEARVSYSVIEAAYGAELSPEQVEQLFSRSFERDSNSSITARLSGLYYRSVGVNRAEAWIVAHKGASIEAIVNVLQGWPDGRETWNVARRFGPEVVAAYWKSRSPQFVQGPRSDLIRSVIMLLRYGRAVEAIQSSLSRLAEVPSKLVLRMLEGVIPQLNARAAAPDTMTTYYVEQVLQTLNKRTDVPVETIATWEYQFFPLLEYGNHRFRIYELLAKDPAAYHSLIRKVFRGKDTETGEPDPRTVADARIAYSVLSHFSLLPGLGPEGIDRAALTTWIDEVRRLGVETDLADVTDSYIGRVLAHAEAGADKVWPPEPVREQIERLSSAEIERSIQMERFNMRGAHFRGVYEGGSEERDFAKTSYEAAAALSAWPKTAELLRSIGRMWEADAKREDIEAAQRRLRS